MRTKVIVGNWKMYKTKAEAKAFCEEFKTLYTKSEHEVGFCCPFTLIDQLKNAFSQTGIKVGAQNMHYEKEGAFTGEISPPMVKELGIDYCIIGHSERRQFFNETDDTVNLKLKIASDYEITPIFCIGENLNQRDSNQEFSVIDKQLKKGLKDLPGDFVSDLIIAYEPVWAIGTGRTASPDQAEEMCRYIRNYMRENYGNDVSEKIRIQYGGSVKSDNATELMTQPNIDGALVGGASLKPEDFIKIVNF